MKKAAIAIGSNSTRLLIADATDGGLANIVRGREETRLFSALDENGLLAQERILATAQAVARLHAQALAAGARDVSVLATSATRDAKNSDALAQAVQTLTGCRLQIISGEEEARLAFRAAAGTARRLVIDVGGGSTEMTLGENGEIAFAASAQMGSTRLLRLCPIACPADAARAREIAANALAPDAAQLASLPPAPRMIGLGGACTTAAAIQSGREMHGDAVEGMTVTRAEAERQLAALSAMTLEERMRVPGLPPTRAAHMPHGLCILLSVMALCGHDALTVSGKTNLDGYLTA